MPEGASGVVLVRVDPLGPAAAHVQVSDVLLEVGGSTGRQYRQYSAVLGHYGASEHYVCLMGGL